MLFDLLRCDDEVLKESDPKVYKIIESMIAFAYFSVKSIVDDTNDAQKQ